MGIRRVFDQVMSVWERTVYLCLGAHIHLLVHELGHLVAGLAFGQRATALRIGDGPSVHLFRRSRFPIQIGLYATSARLEILPPSKHWQAVIAYAAGPAASIIVAVVFFNFHPHGWLSWGLDIWLFMLWAVPGVQNLLPHYPDGKAILGIVRDHFSQDEPGETVAKR